jgi:hypothetical protein
MKLQLPSLVLALSWSSAVNANFDIYSGWVNQAAVYPKYSDPYYQDLWFVFDGEPDCDMAWRVPTYHDVEDVSGTKLGVRCEGSGCSGFGNPAQVSVVEMHFRNDPLLHWSMW